MDRVCQGAMRYWCDVVREHVGRAHYTTTFACICIISYSGKVTGSDFVFLVHGWQFVCRGQMEVVLLKYLTTGILALCYEDIHLNEDHPFTKTTLQSVQESWWQVVVQTACLNRLSACGWNLELLKYP